MKRPISEIGGIIFIAFIVTACCQAHGPIFEGGSRPTRQLPYSLFWEGYTELAKSANSVEPWSLGTAGAVFERKAAIAAQNKLPDPESLPMTSWGVLHIGDDKPILLRQVLDNVRPLVRDNSLTLGILLQLEFDCWVYARTHAKALPLPCSTETEKYLPYTKFMNERIELFTMGKVIAQPRTFNSALESEYESQTKVMDIGWLKGSYGPRGELVRIGALMAHKAYEVASGQLVLPEDPQASIFGPALKPIGRLELPGFGMIFGASAG